MFDEGTENSLIHGVLTPGLQSLISGVFVLCFMGSFTWLVKTVNPVSVGLTCGCGVMSGVWFWLLRGWVREKQGLLTVAEPEHHTFQNVRLEVKQQNQLLFIDLPAEPEQLVNLADGVLHGASMSELTWCGRNKPFSISQFRGLRAELIRRGLAVWRNETAPAQGVELTLPGKAVFRRFLSMAEQHPTLNPGDRWTS